jgi:hypothetical protein
MTGIVVDVELSGIGYKTLIGPTPTWALDPNGGKPAAKTTYPFVAFGAPIPAGNKVTARTPTDPINGIIVGGGTVYSFDPDATDQTPTMRLEAWGLCNPYGIGFDAFNSSLLFVSNNGADTRETCLTTPNGPLSTLCPAGTTLVVRGFSTDRQRSGRYVRGQYRRRSRR